MRLRNKKTKEIIEIDYISVNRSAFDVIDGRTGKKLAENVETMPLCYLGIEELRNEWEDYKPAEPLIKDEKVRKAVRAWAEVNSLKWAAYSADGKFYDKTTDTEISFTTYTNRLDIPECRLLPIAELCGEEEE